MITYYNDELHEYRVEGKIVPSVTQIISAAGLIDNSFFTEAARARGTYIHTAILYYLQDDLVEDSIPDEYKGYMNAFKQFMVDTLCKPLINMCEVPVFNELFAGTPDIICTLKGWESIVDVKTGAESPITGIQTAAYERLLDKSLKRYGLYLKNTGKYKLVPYTDRNDINIFNAALSLYNFRVARGLLNG